MCLEIKKESETKVPQLKTKSNGNDTVAFCLSEIVLVK